MFDYLKKLLDKIKRKKKVSANVDNDIIHEVCLRTLNTPFDFKNIEIIKLYLCFFDRSSNESERELINSTYFNTMPSEYVSEVIESFYLYPINIQQYKTFINSLISKVSNKIETDKLISLDRKYNLQLNLTDIILKYYDLASIYELYSGLEYSNKIYDLANKFSMYFSLDEAKEFFLHYYKMGIDFGLLIWLLCDYSIEFEKQVDTVFSILNEIKKEDYPRLISWLCEKRGIIRYINEKTLESNNLAFQFAWITSDDAKLCSNEIIENLVKQGYHLKELVQNAKSILPFIVRLIYEKDEKILDSILSEISENQNIDMDNILMSVRFLKEYKIKRDIAVRLLKRGTTHYHYLIQLYKYTTGELREISEALNNKGINSSRIQ